jgi:surfactin synthase thioesterase subunit
MTTPKSPWLFRRPDENSRARLFCFPYSGCGASMYREWPREFDGIEVCLIQPPGRENRFREPHYGTYPQLAKDLITDLAPHLDRPFGLFGHCGGALAAYEVSRQLIAADLPTPRRLFVSSQVAPHDGPYGRFLELTRDGLRTELVNLITAQGGTPNPALVEVGLDLLCEDIEGNKQYHVPRQPLACGVTTIGWDGDNEIPLNLMGGWQDIAQQSRSVLLAGGHYAFLKAPQPLLHEFATDLE